MIEDGSPNVFLGGGTQTVLEISPEIPDWLRQVVDVLYVVAGMLGGLAGAWRQAAKMGSKFGTKNVRQNLLVAKWSGWPSLTQSWDCSAIR